MPCILWRGRASPLWEPAAADFSLLDRPQICSLMFYPRPDWTSPPTGARDLPVPAGEGVRLHARIYAGSADVPTVVFFHGNGEVVADYDGIAELYAHVGLNLVVSDYRGYGRSGGSPTYT